MLHHTRKFWIETKLDGLLVIIEDRDGLPDVVVQL